MAARHDPELSARGSERLQTALELLAEHERGVDLERTVAQVLDILLSRLESDAEDAALEELARDLLDEAHADLRGP